MTTSTELSELTQKKNKRVQRGTGIEQLARYRMLEKYRKEMTQMPFPTFNPSVAYPTSDYTAVPNDTVQLRHSPPPPLTTNLYTGVINQCPFHFCDNDTVVDINMDADKNRCTCCSEQAQLELMSILRNRGCTLTEHEFFPGKGGGAEEYKELMSMGPTAASCGTSAAGTVGLLDGKGSYVRAGTRGEKGSVSSLDVFYWGRGVRAFSVILVCLICLLVFYFTLQNPKNILSIWF